MIGKGKAFKQLISRMQADDDDGKGLVEMVMDLLGIDPNAIGEDDNLAGMGIDSMQVVEVRARIQRALGRPIPLEEVRRSLFWGSCKAPPRTMLLCRPVPQNLAEGVFADANPCELPVKRFGEDCACTTLTES